jgi:hypothetical protein
VHPDGSGKVLANQQELRPVLAALCVALVGRGRTEGDGETDDETEHGEQQVADLELVDEFTDACDEGRPEGDDDQGKNHLGQHGAVHAHEDGPFGVLGHVTGANLVPSAIGGRCRGKCRGRTK